LLKETFVLRALEKCNSTKKHLISHYKPKATTEIQQQQPKAKVATAAAVTTTTNQQC